jgi:hypothetical protein
MRFIKSNSGYALVLTLLFMPVFIGMSLLVIDISRGNNAHSDLQAAADSLALAGARELDGGVTSITRAIAAMERINNTVSFLGRTEEAAATTLTFAVDGLDNPFTVVFLSRLPENDDEPLTPAFLEAYRVDPDEDEQGDALFVYVRAQSRDLSPFFGIFLDGVNQVTDVPVAAEAVATFRTAACDITPIFICNPFELEPGTDLQTAFSQGRLHARLVGLNPSSGGEKAGPGNFGYLATAGTGANVLGDALGGGINKTCYDARRVVTEPGQSRSVAAEFNQRFDIYPPGMGGTRYPPAENVRKGFMVRPPANLKNLKDADFCKDAVIAQGAETAFASPFQQSADPEFIRGGVIGQEGEVWPLLGEDGYWAVNHPNNIAAMNAKTMAEITSAPRETHPMAMDIPSRYDVYRYEIAQGLVDETSRGNTDFTANDTYYRESGKPQCYPPSRAPVSEPDRRVLYVAVINCEEFDLTGRDEAAVEAYASVFLATPMFSAPQSALGTLAVEFIDISGPGGNGTLDTFVRDEAILVR